VSVTLTKTIVLIHGACHGAWCWDRVKPALEREGYRVVAPDLPGRTLFFGSGWRLTLKDYAKSIVEVAQAENQPVFAVGHSMAGPIMAQASEIAPELFAKLIFLTAFLPKTGQSLASLGAQDTQSMVSKAVNISLLKGLVTIKSAEGRDVYYNDCSPQDITWAQAQLVPEPLRPSIDKVSLTQARFGTVPRAYIRCLKDRALTLTAQDDMIYAQPCQQVLTLDASHSPFISMPDLLSKTIVSLL
jgi:pimeloyl-ACP methyl ester carboxylesterase